MEREKIEREKLGRERLERERTERMAREKIERERLERERQEKLARERELRERQLREAREARDRELARLAEEKEERRRARRAERERRREAERLERERKQREVELLERERQRQAEIERQREAAERVQRQMEIEKQREADRLLREQRQLELDRQREADRLQREQRQLEIERLKEAEAAQRQLEIERERERKKEVERLQMEQLERQREAERLHREQLERQRETERLQRERREQERMERERARAADRERQKEIEREQYLLQMAQSAPRASHYLQNNTLPYSTSRSIVPPNISTVFATSNRQSVVQVEDTPMNIGLNTPPATGKPSTPPQLPTSSSTQTLTPNPNGNSLYERPHSIINTGVPAISTRNSGQVLPSNTAPKYQDVESPPPLVSTPSSSSHNSLEEVLMTPASMDPARVQTQPQARTVDRSDSASQLSDREKKKGGIFGLFRSNSTKLIKDSKLRSTSKDPEPRRRQSTTSYEQRHEPVSNQRSARPSSRIIEPDSSQLRTSTRMSMSHRITQTYSSSRVSKHIPPPIAIPQHPSAYRLFSSKSKRYRAMSSASMEALDGTAVSIELPWYFVIKVPCIYIDIDLASPIYRTTQL